MGVRNFAFPVLPGKEDEARKFAEEAVGSHAEYYTSLRKASGTTRVTWTLQQTPTGRSFLSGSRLMRCRRSSRCLQRERGRTPTGCEAEYETAAAAT